MFKSCRSRKNVAKWEFIFKNRPRHRWERVFRSFENPKLWKFGGLESVSVSISRIIAWSIFWMKRMSLMKFRDGRLLRLPDLWCCIKFAFRSWSTWIIECIDLVLRLLLDSFCDCEDSIRHRVEATQLLGWMLLKYLSIFGSISEVQVRWDSEHA